MLDASADRSGPVSRPSAALPFGFGDPIVPFATAVRQAAAAARPRRGRIFLVQALYPAQVAGVPEPARATTAAHCRPATRSSATQRYPGILAVRVAEYAPRR